MFPVFKTIGCPILVHKYLVHRRRYVLPGMYVYQVHSSTEENVPNWKLYIPSVGIWNTTAIYMLEMPLVTWFQKQPTSWEIERYTITSSHLNQATQTSNGFSQAAQIVARFVFYQRLKVCIQTNKGSQHQQHRVARDICLIRVVRTYLPHTAVLHSTINTIIVNLLGTKLRQWSLTVKIRHQGGYKIHGEGLEIDIQYRYV